MREGNACPHAYFHTVVSAGWGDGHCWEDWISISQEVPLIPYGSTLYHAFVATRVSG